MKFCGTTLLREKSCACNRNANLSFVMVGFIPAIHALLMT